MAAKIPTGEALMAERTEVVMVVATRLFQFQFQYHFQDVTAARRSRTNSSRDGTSSRTRSKV